MMEAVFRPVVEWPKLPTPNWKQKRATFRASYAKTLDLLERELFYLRAKEIIQAYFERADIRNDGWPRSNARPSNPGVIVTCIAKNGPLSFPCDTFSDWEDNLRAIALSLQALRAVDRYGVTQHAEQYKGFTPLPSAESAMSPQDAAHFLVTNGYSTGPAPLTVDDILTNPQAFGAAYRSAARRLHPDNPSNGDHEAFLKLQKARAVLEKIHPQAI